MWLITHDLGYNVTIAGVVVFDNSQQEITLEDFNKLNANQFYLLQVQKGLITESSVQPPFNELYKVRYLNGEITLNNIPVDEEFVTAITVAEALQRGGGVADYNLLSNKPSINGVTLEGNKTSEDLNITATVASITDAEINNLWS